LGQGGAYDVAVDPNGNAFITGHTLNVLVTPDAVQTIRGGGDVSSSAKDAFVLKIATGDENLPTSSIGGTVTDENWGFNNNYSPIVVTVTGTVNRSFSLPYSSGPSSPFSFGSLPAGGTYTVTVRKLGFATTPDNVVFPNLGANQFADFTIQRNREPQSQITSPPSGAQVDQGQPIAIAATASDPDGHAISKIDFVAYNSASGSTLLATDTEAPFEYTWQNAPLGTWSIYAFAYDELGLKGISTSPVFVTVVDPTGANVSFTGPTDGQHFVQGGYVPIQMSVSSSVNIVEVRNQDNEIVACLTGSPWTSQWRVMQTGDYTLTATAHTQTGQTATAVTHITVDPINHRITGTVRNGITQAGVPNVTLNLTSPSNPQTAAQTTTDSAGNYLFTNLGTTPDDSVVITASGSGYTFEPPARSIGFLGFVNDWNLQNFTATPQTQITVAMTSPTDRQTFNAPATIDLAATATSGAGAITQVDFYRRNLNGTATLLGSDTTAPYQYQLTGVGTGNYIYFARATDATNATAESSAVGVLVQLATVSLSGRVTGPDGSGVAGVEVYIGGGRAWSETTDAAGNFTFADFPGGQNYYVTPLATGGLAYTPTTRSYTNVTTNITGIDFVQSAPNQSPTIQIVAPTDGAVFTMPQPVPIQVTANDPDNNVTRLRVFAQSSQQLFTVVQTTSSSVNTTWQPPVPGTYRITADVLDRGGLTTSPTITITVNQPAPVEISGRIVDRASVGIPGVTVELKDYPEENGVVATATTNATGNFVISGVETFRSYSLTASKESYVFSPQRRTYFNISATRTDADFTGTLTVQTADFDGDNESDFAVWRPSDGSWHITRSQTQQYTTTTFGSGSEGDLLVPGNYDGDRKIDYAVYRKGVWYIKRSSDDAFVTDTFGYRGDTPVPADYDGDGRTDIAVWREAEATWYVKPTLAGGYYSVHFGQAGDKPVVGDFDGDGKADIAVFRPSTFTWYITHSSDGSWDVRVFGAPGDTPIVGDFDGDKKTDVTVFRPSTGYWYTVFSGGAGYREQHWGQVGDMPVAGDYDKDGRTDFAIYRPSTGMWYIVLNATNTIVTRHFGAPGDIPIPAAYVR
jgi:hypothetical protein